MDGLEGVGIGFADVALEIEITWEWMQMDNEERPHGALGKVPPAV